MAIKKQFSFDEEADAEKIIENGFEGKYIDYGKMYLVAKYFRDKFNYGEVRLERELIKFCKEQDKNFNPVVEAESIKKWVRTAMNYDLRKVECITISQKEIDFLKTIEVEKERKLLYTTLIFSKALRDSSTKKNSERKREQNNYYIRYTNLLDIIRISEVKNLSEINFAKILYKYKNLFFFYKAEKELIKLEYVDKIQENPFEIRELDKIMKNYDEFFGKPLGICSICKEQFTKKSNRQKACPKCTKELTRKRVEKWRNKKKKDM